MRIKMSRRAAEEALEDRKLTLELSTNGSRVLEVDQLVCQLPFLFAPTPLLNVEMQSDAQLPMQTRVLGRVLCGRVAHHQTRAGHDSTLVSFDDAAIHTSR